MYPKNRFKTGPNRETGHLKFQFQAVFWCGPKNVNLHFYVQKGFVVQAGGFLFFSPWKTKKKKRLALRARSLLFQDTRRLLYVEIGNHTENNLLFVVPKRITRRFRSCYIWLKRAHSDCSISTLLLDKYHVHNECFVRCLLHVRSPLGSYVSLDTYACIAHGGRMFRLDTYAYIVVYHLFLSVGVLPAKL